jgi:hypothetical protein
MRPPRMSGSDVKLDVSRCTELRREEMYWILLDEGTWTSREISAIFSLGGLISMEAAVAWFRQEKLHAEDPWINGFRVRPIWDRLLAIVEELGQAS